MDPSKSDAIATWPVPQSVKDVQQFLGLANYYNAFVEHFAHIAAPLTDLLSKKSAFAWSQREQQAFEQLRDALCSTPVLKLPDWNKPFVLQTDASEHAVGAVLL